MNPLLKHNNYNWSDLRPWGFLPADILQYAWSSGWPEARALFLEIAQDKIQDMGSDWKVTGEIVEKKKLQKGWATKC